MRILHIEDNAYKQEAIANVLNEFDSISIDWVECLKDGIMKVEESYSNDMPYDLVITDMYYPVEKDGEEVEAGEQFIREATKRKWNVPVILCSSMDFYYPEIYGVLLYSFNDTWKDNLRRYIKKLM